MTQAPAPSGRTVAVTGASGLIGSALSSTLLGRGDQVVHLVRRAPRAPGHPALPSGVFERAWQPGAELAPDVLDGVDAVVHLAGAGIGDKRWTTARKKLLRDSRIDGTGTIARAVAARPERVRDPVCCPPPASATTASGGTTSSPRRAIWARVSWPTCATTGRPPPGPRRRPAPRWPTCAPGSC
ncbi:NAD-dependent epimerase/dehydratase family protein [Ornithinimicrobium sp. W1665]|uniref:NAD-dependent epimerase/dehydratase family protein n=1 Tax=Ornithinimicrobium sp. W1665 TaxID=3416666 RepID=UPI003D6A0414